jgi:uncharacterized protein YeaO (DUF488 family)
MSILIVRLGTPRKSEVGLRLGTVRRPPRGVPEADFAGLDYCDVWFPNLSESPDLLREGLIITNQKEWATFSRKFRRKIR